jgi:hypothetical protein
VLESQPGTGKSETIGYIIAHNLALGRKVLFVSEKMAALEVVFRRLRDKDLGDFCLGVNSNRSSKKGVVDQLAAAWEQRGAETSETWAEKVAELRRLRDGLNEPAGALHTPGQAGITPRQAIGRELRHGDSHPLDLDWGPMLADDQVKSPEGFQSLRLAAAEIGSTFAVLREGDKDALSGVGRQEWSNAWTGEVMAAALVLMDKVRRLKTSGQAFAERMDVRPAEEAMDHWQALETLAIALPNCESNDVGFALTAGGQDVPGGGKRCAGEADDIPKSPE